METRSDYERALRRQVGRLIRRLRRRQDRLAGEASAAQRAWFAAPSDTPEEAAALASLTVLDAFGCGAILAYQAALSELENAARIARLAARIPDGA